MRATQILLASGRVPNVEGLNLEALGVETTKAGIVVDEHLRTSVQGIWATGDVNAIAQLTPVAQYQSRVAVADMFGENAPAADYSVLPTAIFTDPELAGVGLTEEQAREQGHDVGIASNDRVKRFAFIDAKHGLFKIVFDRASRRVLGLHVVSRNASDIVQGLSLGLRLGATVDDLARDASRLPDLRRGRQGRGRAEPPRTLAQKENERRPGQASGLLLSIPARRAGERRRREPGPRGWGRLVDGLRARSAAVPT